ncbi:MAG: kelch repeat-containing protein [Planctomycetota bacterium]
MRPIPALLTLALALQFGHRAPAQVVWTNRGGILGRTNHAQAYDAARGVVVVFGGQGATGGALDDTWEWDGVSWMQRFPSNVPPARHGAAMVYDTRRGICVMVAGYGVSGALRDTWAWTGTDWVPLATTGPGARGLHALAYDQGRDRVVLFGGDQAGGQIRFNDTWEWDGAQWSLQAPASAPSPRFATAMAYDVARQRVVLAGGLGVINQTFTFLDDTYEWDPVAATWVAGPRLPGATRAHAMAYDSAFGGIFLLGPVNSRLALLHYDGLVWQSVPTAHVPSVTLGMGLAFDSRRDRLVAFGGSNLLFVQEATWEWNRTDWERVGGGPPGSSGYRAVYDAGRGVPLLFAVDGQSTVSEWDGRRWTPASLVQTAPGRAYVALGYDRIRRNVVRFGGADLSNLVIVDETWTFDGSAWQLRAPTASPGPVVNAAMAFDEVRGSLILFGGSHITRGLLDETWEWNGNDWTQLHPGTRPGRRQFHAMAYDRRRQRIVLLGANTTLSDTWEWDGNTWTQAGSQPLVATRIPALAYDAARQRVVLFGAGANVDEHWEWDGSNWARRQPAVVPPPRSEAAMTFDETRECVVMFGGTLSQSGRLYTDTWELRSEVEAAYSETGAGCGAGGSPPRLEGVGDQRPWWGETFVVEVTPLPVATVGVALAWAASNSSWNGIPLPFDLGLVGAPGCSLRVGLDVVLPMQVASGSATQAFLVPASSALLGRTLFQQAIVLAPGVNAAGVVLSSARAALIGTR